MPTIVACEHDVGVLPQQRAAVNVVKDLQAAQHSTAHSMQHNHFRAEPANKKQLMVADTM
jgi:hypothetical protein